MFFHLGRKSWDPSARKCHITMRGLGAMACENPDKVRKYKKIVRDLLVHGSYDPVSSEVIHGSMKTDHHPRQDPRERVGLLPLRPTFQTRTDCDGENDSLRYLAFCGGNWPPLLGRNGRNFHQIKRTQDSLLIHSQIEILRLPRLAKARF